MYLTLTKCFSRMSDQIIHQVFLIFLGITSISFVHKLTFSYRKRILQLYNLTGFFLNICLQSPSFQRSQKKFKYGHNHQALLIADQNVIQLYRNRVHFIQPYNHVEKCSIIWMFSKLANAFKKLILPNCCKIVVKYQ